jgi:transporter family-2 protein
VLAGQIALSLILDHFGWVGYAQHQITWLRLVGIGFVFGGVILVMFN